MGISLKKAGFLVSLWTLAQAAYGQTTSGICTELESLNLGVTNGNDRLVTAKSMNIFLAEKVASYLSDRDDLSFYKNSVRADLAAGLLAIDHNFHQPVDKDEYVRSFTLMGARVGFADAFTSSYAGRYALNKLGIALQRTWIGVPVTHYVNTGLRKQAIDGQRGRLLYQLETDMLKDATAFEANLLRLQQSDVPGQSLSSVQSSLRRDFYIQLRTNYLQLFNEGQSVILKKSTDGFFVNDFWTSAGVYIPVFPEKFEFVSNGKSYAYPVALFLNHTRFWVGPHLGRVYLTFAGHCLLNNSAAAGLLPLNTEGHFTGDFRHFLTPSLTGKITWLPGDSHVGLSFKMEKMFGELNTSNAIAGIPIVLIDKNGVPALNFEAQLRIGGIGDSGTPYVLPGNRTTVGLTIGMPFSKIVY